MGCHLSKEGISSSSLERLMRSVPTELVKCRESSGCFNEDITQMAVKFCKDVYNASRQTLWNMQRDKRFAVSEPILLSLNVSK
jgi:hypothetical protein